jgi:hypothetical protein
MKALPLFLKFGFLLLVILIVYLLLGPTVCEMAFKGGQQRVVTLARLHNLKVVMFHISEMAAQGIIDFPEDIGDLVPLLLEELGPADFMDISSSLETLIDGWGNEMRFEGDIEKYFVRSAGPDKKFYTDDDIYLTGNPDGEYIIDGSSQKILTARALSTRMKAVPFLEPTGYYRVSLPGRYTVIPKYEGDRSEITFLYARDNYVKIIAEPTRRDWNPEEEMNDRLGALQSGLDEEFFEFKILSYNLVQFEDGSGYEINLQNDDILAHEYGMYNNFYVSVTVLIMASGEERQEIMDILTEEVRTNLKIH